MKPRIFIGSSAESLVIAEAANENLDYGFEVSIWHAGTFKLSNSTIDDLIIKASNVDFALFIFSPDDIATIRNNSKHVVRDNVIFELGLFVGSIGKERCFILKPRGLELHLPTDLLGLNFAEFEPNRTDNDFRSATSAACAQIRRRSEELGIIRQTTLPDKVRFQSNPPNYPLVNDDYKFLSECLESRTTFPSGLPFYRIANGVKSIPSYRLRLAAVKLERLNMIEKSIEVDERDGYDYFSYAVTEQGVDVLLKNVKELEEEEDPFDDDVPF